jgi:hypothetical protein
VNQGDQQASTGHRFAGFGWRKQNSGYVGSPLHLHQLIQGMKIVQMTKILKEKKSAAFWTKNAWQGQQK